MRAILITKPGDPTVLKIDDVQDPEPLPDQLLVKVHATAVNRADLLQRMGHYPPPSGTREDIPGLEFAGEVAELGDNVKGFAIGDRVMGLLPGEGYAEKVITDERMAIPIPDNLNWEQAASIPEVFLTAYDALFHRLKLERGERLLIHAVGSGVGIAALQLARATEAKVFGTAGSDEKISKAKDLGLDIGINYKTHDFAEIVATETAEHGVNGILDVVGAAYWERNLKCLAQKGRMVLVGLLGGAKLEVNLSTLMQKRAQIIGTVLRTRPLEEKIALTQAFRENALQLFETGRVRPVIDCIFPVDKASEAHAYMGANKNFGKIVLNVSQWQR